MYYIIIIYYIHSLSWNIYICIYFLKYIIYLCYSKYILENIFTDKIVHSLTITLLDHIVVHIKHLYDSTHLFLTSIIEGGRSTFTHVARICTIDK